MSINGLNTFFREVLFPENRSFMSSIPDYLLLFAFPFFINVDVFRIQLKLAFVFVFGFRFSPQLFCCSSFIVLFVYSAFIIVFWHDISSCRQLVYRYPAAAILAISVAILKNCLMHVCLLFSSVAILLTCL